MKNTTGNIGLRTATLLNSKTIHWPRSDTYAAETLTVHGHLADNTTTTS